MQCKGQNLFWCQPAQHQCLQIYLIKMSQTSLSEFLEQPLIYLTIKVFEWEICQTGLFKELLVENPWVRALEGREVQESWLIFKEHFLWAQDRSTPKSEKLTKEGRRPAWINKELLAKLKQEKEIYRMWRKGLVMWEKYRSIVRVCRDAHLELNLASDGKGNKKGVFKYISSKGRLEKTWACCWMR